MIENECDEASEGERDGQPGDSEGEPTEITPRSHEMNGKSEGAEAKNRDKKRRFGETARPLVFRQAPFITPD